MILDAGICTIYKQTDVSEPGEMPRYERTVKAQSYYAELQFETSPVWPTEHREETKIAARVRILQERSITKGDHAALTPGLPTEEPERMYRVVRAFHGIDDENGQPISDLSLEVMEP